MRGKAPRPVIFQTGADEFNPHNPFTASRFDFAAAIGGVAMRQIMRQFQGHFDFNQITFFDHRKMRAAGADVFGKHRGISGRAVNHCHFPAGGCLAETFGNGLHDGFGIVAGQSAGVLIDRDCVCHSYGH